MYSTRIFGSSMAIATILLAVILSFTSCKKGPSPSGSPTSTNSNSSVLSNGFFLSYRATNMYLIPNLFSTSTGHSAAFTSSPSLKADNNIYALVDSVKLNGQRLQLDGNNANLSYLLSMSDTCQCFPETWTVFGNTTIPSLTFTDTSAYPGYAGYAQIPDTLDRTQNYVVPISGLSNFDSYSVTLCGTKTYSRNFSAVSSPVTFVKDSVAIFNAGPSSFVKITLTRTHYQQFGGKNFSFQKLYVFYRSLFVK